MTSDREPQQLIHEFCTALWRRNDFLDFWSSIRVKSTNYITSGQDWTNTYKCKKSYLYKIRENKQNADLRSGTSKCQHNVGHIERANKKILMTSEVNSIKRAHYLARTSMHVSKDNIHKHCVHHETASCAQIHILTGNLSTKNLTCRSNFWKM